MGEISNLDKFFQDLNQEIINKSSLEEIEDFKENIFTQIYIDYLTTAAEIEDGNISFFEKKGSGIKINGYSITEDESSLDLFVSIFKNSQEITTVSPSEAQTMINRLKQFYLKSIKGYYSEIEESTEAYDISLHIFNESKKINKVRLILFTNSTIKSTILNSEEVDGTFFIPTVWDLERIYRVISSGNAREKIDIDLEEVTNEELYALKIKTEGNIFESTENELSCGYTSYLTVIRGDVLFKIYEKYGTRLLEKNVRAFLQTKGSVNKGIRNTILSSPQMFLAYNNGISATAEYIEEGNPDKNKCIIKNIKDFQIVNGGQTTASIFNSCYKDKQNLDKIFVQAKITVVEDPTQIENIVPKISEFANTQNKVQLADFSANDPFHQEIERLSRSIWAPAKTGGEKQTKWFYERARGQYSDLRSREKNPKLFDSFYPKSQYFDKLQLARYENVWEQLPYVASKGGQTSFREFTIRLKKRGKLVPDENYYELLIAKAILYREIRKIVSLQKFKGYWANVSDYTFSYLSYISAQRIDLKNIWKTQNISESLRQKLNIITPFIYNYITQSAEGRNVSQWCKQEKCWTDLLKISNDVTLEKSDLINDSVGKIKQNIDIPTEEENVIINDIMNIDSDIWFSVASWGKETNSLKPYQRGISGTLAKLSSWKKSPSIKQSKQGLLILLVAVEKGFIKDDFIQNLLFKHKELIDSLS